MVVVGVLGIILAYNAHDEQLADMPMGDATDSALQGDNYSNGVGSAVLPGFHSPVDGLPMANESHLEYFAMIIDNYTFARPASGIDQASLVIEAPAEGGITRLMAFFLNGLEIDQVGPVRSARPYFVEWAEEYGAVLAHVGGSPAALAMLKQTEYLRSLNEMQRGGYFWRDKTRDAPHNVYTSSDLLQAALDKIDPNQRELDYERPFKDSALGGSEARQVTVDRIAIDYSVPNYHVTWSYDEDSNRYVRHQGEGKVRTADGEVVRADNIIVQVTDIQVIDAIGRKEIRTVGEGEALVFLDGRAIEARWQKNTGERTRFLFADNDIEIPLNVGVTWLQVVATDTPVEY
jgi:hypothetical protein